MTSFGSILKAHSKCPAGIDGRCNHVASTLFALEQHFKNGQKTSSDSEESSISKPCKWLMFHASARVRSNLSLKWALICQAWLCKEKENQKAKVNQEDINASDQGNWPSDIRQFSWGSWEYELKLEKPLDGHIFFPKELMIRKKHSFHLSNVIRYQLIN